MRTFFSRFQLTASDELLVWFAAPVITLVIVLGCISVSLLQTGFLLWAAVLNGMAVVVALGIIPTILAWRFVVMVKEILDLLITSFFY